MGPDDRKVDASAHKAVFPHISATPWGVRLGQVIEETHDAWKKLREGSTDKGKLWVGK